MIAKTNNAVGVTGAAVAVTAIAVVSSVLSWRRTAQIQNELDSLKEEKRLTAANPKEPPDEAGARDHNRHQSNHDRNTEEKNNNKHQNKHKPKQPAAAHAPPEEGDCNDLSVMRIGVIRSIYRLCVGTPRQGLLAPDARGRIELDKIGNTSTGATVSGLEEFSYVWVLFHFHLNTQSSKKERRFKSKIAPPALGGKKVGIYATRSPHRHNPIGITLCKLDRIQVHGPHEVTLHVSGLDLVDGTPVLDIKPYVPVYDSVHGAFSRPGDGNGGGTDAVVVSADAGTSQSQTAKGGGGSSSDPSSAAAGLQLPPPRVPEWVQGGLATKRNVVIAQNARDELEAILRTDSRALEFYGPHCFVEKRQRNKGGGNDADSTLQTMLRVIDQVLSIDVRSSHQTRKARTGRSQAERAKRIQTRFDVKKQQGPSAATATTSNGSGAVAGNEKDCAATAATTVAEEPPEKKMCTQQLDNLLIYFNVKETKANRDASEGSGAEDGITVESIKILPNTEQKKRGRR